ncbi:MAG: DNA mismatch repair protein MutT, partial [Lachnospiraceae bacterium]|nr:DNA mismatch repair protein MutT [Lachnospiraceae bacterium]
YEETGLTLKSYCFRGIVDFVQEGRETESMYLYTADGFTGTPHPCDEGELAWVLKEDVFSLSLWEGDRVFLEKLLRDEPFFLLTLKYQGDRLVGAEDGRAEDAGDE